MGNQYVSWNYTYDFYLHAGLKNEIRAVCAEEFLVCGEGDEHGATWMDKVKKIIFYTIKSLL